jgi:hypothetical protein
LIDVAAPLGDVSERFNSRESGVSFASLWSSKLSPQDWLYTTLNQVWNIGTGKKEHLSTSDAGPWAAISMVSPLIFEQRDIADIMEYRF